MKQMSKLEEIIDSYPKGFLETWPDETETVIEIEDVKLIAREYAEWYARKCINMLQHIELPNHD